MVLFFSLILFVQVCICLASIRLHALPGQLIKSIDEQRHNDIALTAAFGFDTVDGTVTYNQLFDNLGEKETVLVDVSDSLDLLNFNGKECALVGYVSAMELEAGSERFLQHIQTYVAGVIRSDKRSSQLILVIEGKPDARSGRMQQVVRELVEEAQLFDKTINVTFQHVASGDEQGISQAKDSITSILTAAAKDVQNLVSVKELRLLLADSALVGSQTSRGSGDKVRKTETSPNMLRDRESAELLVNDFIDKVNVSIHDLFESGLVSVGATVNTTMQALNATLVEVSETHTATHSPALSRLQDSPVLQDASMRCRQRLLHMLLQVHRSILQSMLQGSMEAFDKRAARLTGVTKLPKLMRLLSAATVQGFSQSADKVQQEFLCMLSMSPEEGLLRSAGANGVEVKRAVKSWKACFNAGLERRRLQEYTKQHSVDRVNTLFLAGTYNPYVRDSPLPPIHLNLNYLVDPIATKLAWEYRNLYDEHKEGPCEKRADPLIFPGVAAIPFDPNSHPVPSEKGVRWFTVVKDFFTKD